MCTVVDVKDYDDYCRLICSYYVLLLLLSRTVVLVIFFQILSNILFQVLHEFGSRFRVTVGCHDRSEADVKCMHARTCMYSKIR